MPSTLLSRYLVLLSIPAFRTRTRQLRNREMGNSELRKRYGFTMIYVWPARSSRPLVCRDSKKGFICEHITPFPPRWASPPTRAPVSRSRIHRVHVLYRTVGLGSYLTVRCHDPCTLETCVSCGLYHTGLPPTVRTITPAAPCKHRMAIGIAHLCSSHVGTSPFARRPTTTI